MSTVRLFKDLDKKVKSVYKKNVCFFYEPLWSKFSIFSLTVIFSTFLDGIKEKVPKHQTR